MMSDEKKNLRTLFRSKRAALTAEERLSADHAIATTLSQQPWQQQKQHFALYIAMKDELSTEPLLDILWQQQKACYLPKLMPDQTLVFAPYNRDATLIANRFGIGEPTTEPIDNSLLEIIFMPLVAFDVQGHRLGMGAGYYDRTLATLMKQAKPPLLIGLAYDVQKAENIIADPWDIDMDFVVTEKKVYSK